MAVLKAVRPMIWKTPTNIRKKIAAAAIKFIPSHVNETTDSVDNFGGILSIIGIPTVDRISFPMDVARRREIRIQNVRRQAHCAEPTLEMLAQRRIRPEFMVTHRFPFARTPEAFDLVAGLGDGVIKAMIDF